MDRGSEGWDNCYSAAPPYVCGAGRGSPGPIGGAFIKWGSVPTGCVGSSLHTYSRPSPLVPSLVLLSFPNSLLPSFPFPPLDSVIPLPSCLPPSSPCHSPLLPALSIPVVLTVAAGLGGVALQGCEVQGAFCCGQLQDFRAKWLFQRLSLVKGHCLPKVWSTLIGSSAPWALTHLLAHLYGQEGGSCPGA